MLWDQFVPALHQRARNNPASAVTQNVEVHPLSRQRLLDLIEKESRISIGIHRKREMVIAKHAAFVPSHKLLHRLCRQLAQHSVGRADDPMHDQH